MRAQKSVMPRQHMINSTLQCTTVFYQLASVRSSRFEDGAHVHIDVGIDPAGSTESCFFLQLQASDEAPATSTNFCGLCQAVCVVRGAVTNPSTYLSGSEGGENVVPS